MILPQSSPDAESANYLQSLLKGTTLAITTFTVCTPLLGGAHLWWGVQIESRLVGWASEASVISDMYYLQEMQ